MKVYRSGPVARTRHGERALEHFSYVDYHAPTGRLLRSEAIFASPQVSLLNRWIKLRKDRASRYPDADPIDVDAEIRVLEVKNSDNAFVYDSTTLLAIFAELNEYPPGKRRLEVDVSSYWNSGIPLTEWSALRPKVKNPSLWEVMIHPDDIVSESLHIPKPRRRG